jgi:hypothetical protein
VLEVEGKVFGCAGGGFGQVGGMVGVGGEKGLVGSMVRSTVVVLSSV